MKCSREIKELLFLMFSYIVINTYLIKISRRAHYFILFTRDIMSYVFFYFDYLFINEIKKKQIQSSISLNIQIMNLKFLRHNVLFCCFSDESFSLAARFLISLTLSFHAYLSDIIT